MHKGGNDSTVQRFNDIMNLRLMRVTVCFYSYFKDLTGSASVEEILPDGSTLEALLKNLHHRFPKLSAMQKSTLAAVGLDYQRPDYVLKEGDEVSLFPPLQGG